MLLIICYYPCWPWEGFCKKELGAILMLNFRQQRPTKVFSLNWPLSRFSVKLTMSVSLFSPTRPHWAELVIESACPSVCLFAPASAAFFEASHWPSGHMTRSWPLIGQPPPAPHWPPEGGRESWCLPYAGFFNWHSFVTKYIYIY